MPEKGARPSIDPNAPRLQRIVVMGFVVHLRLQLGRTVLAGRGDMLPRKTRAHQLRRLAPAARFGNRFPPLTDQLLCRIRALRRCSQPTTIISSSEIAISIVAAAAMVRLMLSLMPANICRGSVR